jgi:hypothetical protein
MKIKKQTPILSVEAIEPLLPFWIGKLGYAQLAEVPHEGRLGFVMLERDGQTIMLQTEASIVADLGAGTVPGLRAGSVFLYIDVDRIDDAVQLVRASGAKVICGPRETSYRAKELFAVAPGGVVVGFAEHHR